MKDDLKLFGRLAREASSSWRHVTALFLVGLLASPLALLAPLPLKIAVDSVLGSRPLPGFLDAVLPEAVTGSTGALLLCVAAFAVLVTLLSQMQALAQQYLSTTAGEQLVLRFRAEIFDHLQRLSLSYHDSTGTADSLYRMQHDAPAIRSIVIEGVIPFVRAAVTLGAMIYVTAVIDWQLAVAALGVTPPLLLIVRHYRPRLRRRSRHVKKLESQALGVVHEVLGALRVVKAFGQEQREGARFVRRSQEGVQQHVRLVLSEGVFKAFVGLVVAAGTASVLFIGISHVQSGVLSLGDLLLVMGYVAQLYSPMKTISRKVATLQNHLASVERAFAVLDLEPELTERSDARPITRARGAVAFRGVSFRYDSDRPALHDISFEIAPETQLGIVGATGAGKTTLVSLLTRLYDPTEGQILLDGVDLRDYRLDDLRRQFAVVLQDSVLFSGRIADNIAYALPDASHEQIVAAARAANAHDFIERLPQGYDTEVGERGVKLSGGQRQRIALARAFLKDSPVLILDEPTSAVDRETEAAIVEAIERLKRGRTVILISHRPGAVARCTALLTIEHGRLVGEAMRTTAALPGRPAVTPARFASAKRRETILAHPAVQAWRRLVGDGAAPDRITLAKFKPNKPRSILKVFRLDGVGVEGENVIAKRCKRHDGLIERAVYEQVLPRVPLPGPRYYGAVEDPHDDPADDVCWLFIGEVEGEAYDALRPDHRAAAARWLGILHTEARWAADRANLPDAGPNRYREGMRRARDVIRDGFDNPALSADDLAFLDALLARLDQVDEHWSWLERAYAGAPRTLIHGDFNGKNLRVQGSPDGPRIVVYDWEDAGLGVPAVDLAQQVVATAGRLCARPDLDTYWAVVRERWPECDREDIERLATCGTAFRALDVLTWEARHLAHAWADAFLSTLQSGEAELTAALDRLLAGNGGPASAHRHAALGNRAG